MREEIQTLPYSSIIANKFPTKIRLFDYRFKTEIMSVLREESESSLFSFELGV